MGWGRSGARGLVGGLVGGLVRGWGEEVGQGAEWVRKDEPVEVKQLIPVGVIVAHETEE